VPSASPPNEHVRRSGATYSPCGLYRYRLWRDWGGGATLLWIMLNPSTADHLGNNDATIARCERRAMAWGFSRVEVVNLFAFRTPHPKVLFAAADPVGPGNDPAILEATEKADLILCGWGSLGGFAGRAARVLDMLRGRELACLGVNRSGEPTHPLYQPYSARPTPYRSPPNANRYELEWK